MPRGASHSAAHLAGCIRFLNCHDKNAWLKAIAAPGTCGCFLLVDDACPIFDALVFLSSFLSLAPTDAFSVLFVALLLRSKKASPEAKKRDWVEFLALAERFSKFAPITLSSDTCSSVFLLFFLFHAQRSFSIPHNYFKPRELN